tara:strand:- start:603 stop:950 length:348 start_codon:yes stop_codon:yes gene_type:complete
MIWNKYVLITIIIFFVNNIIIWYQLNGQLVWPWWKTTQGFITSMLLAVPTAFGFWLATKWGYEGFGALWPVRFMGFATSMMTFPLMTWLYLGETITLKTLVTIILSIVIMLLQLL